MMRPKLLWARMPIARLRRLSARYTHCGWYGFGIGHWFIGVQVWTPVPPPVVAVEYVYDEDYLQDLVDAAPRHWTPIYPADERQAPVRLNL